MWSVSVEEQLYILLPLVIFFTGKRGLKIFSVSAIVIGYGTIVYYALRPTTGFSGQWTNSFVQFQFFAAGILLSVYLKGSQPKWHVVPRIVSFVAGITCWLIASIVCEINADSPHLATISQSISGWLLILTGVILMFLALYGSSAKYMPLALAYLGRISYGMYVFHITIYWLIFSAFKDELGIFSQKSGIFEWKNWIGFVIAFAVTVTLATLSYKFFEKPFLKLKNRFTLIPSRD